MTEKEYSDLRLQQPELDLDKYSILLAAEKDWVAANTVESLIAHRSADILSDRRGELYWWE